jgi:hypothetical protein
MGRREKAEGLMRELLRKDVSQQLGFVARAVSPGADCKTRAALAWRSD